MRVAGRIAGGFLIALAVITVLAVLSYQETERQIDAQGLVTHTHLVIEKLDAALAALQDAETGERGYVLTGNPSYLAPYTAAEGRISPILADVKALTADNPLQQHNADRLRTIAEAKLAELAETIRLRDQSGEAAAQALIVAGRGARLMDDARAAISRMQAEERRLLDARTRDAQATARRTTATLAAAGPLLVLGLGIAVLLITTGMTDRLRRQAAELHEQNEELTEQSEQLSQQAEELSHQSEELSQQAEELTTQNEELQAQSEEIRSLNVELGRREDLLQALLDAARLAASERVALHEVCSAGLPMFETAEAVVVYEKRGNELVIRTSAGLPSEMADSVSAEHRFAELVIEQNRTASLNDTALRPDLSILDVPAQPPFRSVLAAPMQANGSAFGAVAVYSRQATEWTAEQFRLAGWLAAQCAHILAILRLQADLRRQAALLDLTPDAIIVRKVDGTITSWGHGAEQLYGWTKEEAIGRTTHEILQTRFPIGLEEINRQLQQTGFWSGDLVHTARDGREVNVESRWRAERDGSGQITEMLESNVDITARLKTERALRESDRRKSEFLATLSHELRNPLAPIRYALEVLRCDGDATSAAHPKRVIERQLGHMVHLVDDLLDVTRIASNKIRLRRRRVNLAEVVQQAVEATAPDIEQANHSLVVTLPDDPLWLDVDPDRLAQVLTNLLNNAARYTPNGGRLSLSAKSLGREVIVSVTDSGVGLKSEDRDRVFEMFTQVGDPGQGGLGIGLALVKGLVELHGGRVEARSEGPGHGSQFIIRLPRADAPSAREEAARAERHTPGIERRVLVVDDNADSADMLKTFLELHGHEVRIANDGASALALMPEFLPEVGLFDIGLPGMSGYELARRVRDDGRYDGIFLVAVTGWGQEEDRQRAHECGFNAHLTKPADPADLQRVLARASSSGGDGF